MIERQENEKKDLEKRNAGEDEQDLNHCWHIFAAM